MKSKMLLATIILMAAIALPGMAAFNAASSTTLRTASGGVLGYIDSGSGKVAVRDSSKAIIGYVDSRGTYNKSKKKIAGSRLPGLLFCGKI